LNRARLNRQQQAEIERLPTLLDKASITGHVRRAVAAAPLLTDPYEHVVVERLLPDALYELLIRAIPPVKSLPPQQRAMWRNKAHARPEYA